MAMKNAQIWQLVHLTSTEVEKFASAKGVKRIAVENFLSSLDTSIGDYGYELWVG